MPQLSFRILAACALCALAGVLHAQTWVPDYSKVIDNAIERHILPGFDRFRVEAATLSSASKACGNDEAPLRAAYHVAFDAWIDVAHLRLGPTETDNAAFAVAFWPDPKGHTTRALGALIRDRDPVVDDPKTFAEVSIAARGFFALERLLFDPAFAGPADGYRCRLVGAITGDISEIATRIHTDWQNTYAVVLCNPDGRLGFQDPKEVVQGLYSKLTTAAEFNMNARVRRPVGTNERARPKRAEAWRSNRSNRNIQRSLAALETMFEDVFANALPERAAIIVRGEFYTIRRMADTLPKPMMELVKDPAGRRKAIQIAFAYEELLRRFDGLIRPSLGLSTVFNALDGD